MSEPISIKSKLVVQAPKLEDLVYATLNGTPIEIDTELILDGDSVEAAIEAAQERTNIWKLLF